MQEPYMKYEISGSGSPLVLVPGMLTGWMSWEPHAEQLSNQYKVIRVQLLSVELGLLNQRLPQEYSVNYETEALANVLNKLKITQADFAAWSYGAEITLNYALNNPDRVRTLTLIEPTAIWVLRNHSLLTPDLLDQQKHLQSLATENVSEEQLEWFTHFVGFVPSSVDPKKLPSWPNWVRHRQSLRNGDAFFRHQDDIARIRGFEKPVLLIKGDDSAPFLTQITDILAEEFPHVRVKVLPGGHAPHVVGMDQFLTILKEFLRAPTI